MANPRDPFGSHSAGFSFLFSTEMMGTPEKMIAYLNQLTTALTAVATAAALTDKTVASTFTNMGRTYQRAGNRGVGGFPGFGAGQRAIGGAMGATGQIFRDLMQDPTLVSGAMEQLGSATARDMSGGRARTLGGITAHQVYATSIDRFRIFGQRVDAEGKLEAMKSVPRAHITYNKSGGLLLRGEDVRMRSAGEGIKAAQSGGGYYNLVHGMRGGRLPDFQSPLRGFSSVQRELGKELRAHKENVRELVSTNKSLSARSVAAAELATSTRKEAASVRKQGGIDDRWKRKISMLRGGTESPYESQYKTMAENIRISKEQSARQVAVRREAAAANAKLAQQQVARDDYMKQQLGYARPYTAPRGEGGGYRAFRRGEGWTDGSGQPLSATRARAYDDFMEKAQQVRGGDLSGITRAQQQQYYQTQQDLVSRYGFSSGKAKQATLAGAGRFLGSRTFGGDMNLFARTAVAMSVLYGMQAQGRATIGSARIMEQGTAQIAGITGQDFPGQGEAPSRLGMRARIFNISTQLGKPHADVLRSLETVFQASDVPSKEALRITKLSAELSRASGSPMEPITDILMDAVNAFKLRGEQINQFAATLFEARTKGVIEFPEIAQGAGKVFQAARLSGFLGLGGDDGLGSVMAMVAAATRQGGTGATASTSVARFIEDIGKPRTIEKLAKLGVNAPTPFARIQQIVAKEQATRAAGEPSFIATSGAFTRIQSRRGGSVLSDQWDLVESMRGFEGDIENFERAVDITMSTSTAKWEKFHETIENTRTLIGTDLISEFDNLLTPILAISDAVQGVGEKHPGVGLASGVLRGMGTAALGMGMLGVGAQLAGKLLGVNMVPLETVKGGMLGAMHPSQMGMNMQALWAGLTGNKAYAQTLAFRADMHNELIGRSAPQYSLGRRVGGVSGNVIAARGQIRGGTMLGVGLGVLATKYALDTGLREIVNYKGIQASAKQDIFEEAMYDFKDISGFAGSARSTIGRVRRGLTTKGEGFEDLLKSLGELQTTMPDIAEKYGLIVNQSQKIIEINGIVATSFDTIAESVMGLTEQAMGDKYIETLVLAQETIKAESDMLTAQNYASISSKINIGTILGVMASGFTAPWDKGEMWRSVTGITQMELTREQLQDRDNLIVKKMKEFYDKRDEDKDRPSGYESETLETVKDIYEKRKRLVESTREELEAVDAQVELLIEIEGLTKEQTNVRRKELENNILTQTASALLATNVGETADLSIWIKDNYQEFGDLLKPSIESMRKIAQGAENLAQVLTILAREMPDVGGALGGVSAALSVQQSQRARTFTTGSRLANIVNARWRPDIQPVANLMMRGRMGNIQLGMNLANLSGSVRGYEASLAVIGSERTKAAGTDSIMDAALRELETNPAAYERIKDRFSGYALENSYTTFNLLETRKSLKEQRTNREKGFARDEQAALRNLQGSAAPVTDTILDLLGIPFEMANIFKNTTFDPEAVPELNKLLGDPFLNKNAFARSPRAVWETLRSSTAYSALTKLDPGGYGTFDTALQGLFSGVGGFQTWGEVSKAPVDDARLTKFYESLYGLMQGSTGGAQGQDLIATLVSITDQWNTLDVETMAKISTGFQSVDEALGELAATIMRLTSRVNENVVDIPGLLGEPVTPVVTLPSGFTDTQSAAAANNALISELGGYWTERKVLSLTWRGTFRNKLKLDREELAELNAVDMSTLYPRVAKRTADEIVELQSEISLMEYKLANTAFGEARGAKDTWVPYGDKPIQKPRIGAELFYDKYGRLSPQSLSGSFTPSQDAVAATKKLINNLGGFGDVGCVLKTRASVLLFTKDSPEYASIMSMLNSTASVGSLAPLLETNPLTPRTNNPMVGDFIILERPGTTAGHSGLFMGYNEAGVMTMPGNSAGSVIATGYKKTSQGGYVDRNTAGLWAYENPASLVRMSGGATPLVANIQATASNTAALNALTVTLGGVPAANATGGYSYTGAPPSGSSASTLSWTRKGVSPATATATTGGSGVDAGRVGIGTTKNTGAWQFFEEAG